MAASNSPERGPVLPTTARDRRLFLAGLIVVCLLFFSSYSSRLARRAEVVAEMHQWEQKIAGAEQRKLVLEDKLAYYSSDEYADKVAREQLGLAKPGDQVIVVIETTPVPTSAPAEATENETQRAIDDSAPLWQQWLSLFAQARDLIGPTEAP
jgi:cell division protein FtsB